MIHRKLRALCERLLILPALILCIGSPGAFAATIGGGNYYVSGSGDDDTGNGSESNPWRTITHAVSQAGVDGSISTIMVGAGTYSPSSGESFPIDLDQHGGTAGAQQISIIGPGDGSALIGETSSEALLLPISYLIEADSYVNGQIVISGLDFEGYELGPSVKILRLQEGAASVRIENNNAADIGLLVVDQTPYGGDYLIADNSVVIENPVATYFNAMRVDFDGLDAFSTTVSANLTVQANTFIGVERAVSYSAYCSEDRWMDLDVLIEGNTFEGCERAIYEYGSATSEARLDMETLINGNTITDGGRPIQLSFEASYTAEINRDIKITNNTIEASNTGIGFETSIDEYLEYNETVLIEGNSITSGGNGIYQSFEKSYELSNLDRDWDVLRNTITDCGGSAVHLCQDYSSSRTEQNYDLTIDGNTITKNGGGVALDHYISYSATSSWKHVVTRNHFSDNSSFAVNIYMTAEDSSSAFLSIDHDVVVRGNVFQGNASESGPVVGLQIDYRPEIYSDYDLSFNMGTDSAYGYNTIVADETNPLSASISCSVPLNNNTTADLSIVGNWWGTQDAGVIENRVYHGPDLSEHFTADLSNPLPDSLNFTAEYVEGVGIVATAGEDAGFVAYAGDLIMTGSLTGPFGSDGGDVEASWVSEDYQTLTLPEGEEDEFSPPPGTYELCLTNPGGQTGCATFTVESDEDCSQNQIPTAVSEDADTFGNTPVTVDVTENDWDPNGNLDPTSVAIIDTPDKGGAIVNEDGSITYTPNAGMVDDADSLTYIVYDTCGAPSNAATLHVRIGGAGTGGGDGGNQIPTANYDEVATEQDSPVTVDILANDEDANGDALLPGSVTIIDAPGKGSATVNADGTVTYTPSPSVAGTTDTFTYTVQDEHG
ncbi:MAG: Ig-like domain-containing protein, partial [Planctomycetes bacterium]|nr:Ig-like domain-containing protein [Planctomycetota bacterium]